MPRENPYRSPTAGLSRQPVSRPRSAWDLAVSGFATGTLVSGLFLLGTPLVLATVGIWTRRADDWWPLLAGRIMAVAMPGAIFCGLASAMLRVAANRWQRRPGPEIQDPPADSTETPITR